MRKQSTLKKEEAWLGRLVISEKITEETYDQVHLRRQVVEQEGESGVDGLGGDKMVIVEDEGEAAPYPSWPGQGACRRVIRGIRDFVDQGHQKRFDRLRLRGLEHRQGRFADTRFNRL